MKHFIKGLFGLLTTENKDVCKFSEKYWDIHDYPKSKGGDGVPTHFHEYKCPECGKKFGI